MRKAAILLSMLLATGAMAKVDMVVVDARGVKLSPGQVIDGSVGLTLTDGQQVSLMLGDGRMIKLRGPSDKPPAPSDSGATVDVKLALQALVTQQNQRERSGVIRGAGSQAIPPEAFLVDVSSSGLRCLPANSPIVLWRPVADADLPLQVTPSDRSWKAQADWAAGQDRLALPPNIPLPKRSTYVVKLGAKEVTLTLIALPASLTNDAMRAGFMMEAGCDAQAKALFQKSGAAPQ